MRGASGGSRTEIALSRRESARLGSRRIWEDRVITRRLTEGINVERTLDG